MKILKTVTLGSNFTGSYKKKSVFEKHRTCPLATKQTEKNWFNNH